MGKLADLVRGDFLRLVEQTGAKGVEKLCFGDTRENLCLGCAGGESGRASGSTLVETFFMLCRSWNELHPGGFILGDLPV